MIAGRLSRIRMRIVSCWALEGVARDKTKNNIAGMIYIYFLFISQSMKDKMMLKSMLVPSGK